jgi:hypothetical protein
MYFSSISRCLKRQSKNNSAGKKNGGYVEISTKSYGEEDKEDCELKVKSSGIKTIDSLKERFEYKDITVYAETITL